MCDFVHRNCIYSVFTTHSRTGKLILENKTRMNWSFVIVMIASLTATCTASVESNSKSLKDSYSQKDIKLLACVQTQLCIQGYQWDSQQCKCVPTCVDNVLCIIGQHWDSSLCACVKDCPQKNCPTGHSWNPQTCKCVKN